MSEMVDVFETAADLGMFATLAKALEAAELVEYLKSPGPFTVFAPTDEAFSLLPEGSLDSLLDKPIPQLREILLHHVLDGSVASTDLTDGLELMTGNGESVEFTVDGDLILIDEALIIRADLEASNGIVHAVDKVILPPVATPIEPVTQEPLTETLSLEA